MQVPENDEIDSHIESRLGLVLSGGGSRAAYQAGVISGVFDILHRAGKLAPNRLPFPIISGVSAGAMNAAFLASHAQDPLQAAREMVKTWENIQADQVFRTDFFKFASTLARLAGNLIFRRFVRVQNLKPPYSLLDASPLRNFLKSKIDFSQIRTNLDAQVLEAIAITATDYWNSNSISFVESGGRASPWQRKRRFGIEAQLEVDHILASSAIPIFFSPIAVDGRFYGDGSVRNMAPLSPAIHLRASKLMIVSVKKPVDEVELPKEPSTQPSPAKVLSMLLNALMLDQTDFDMERLMRINATLRAMEAAQAQTPDPQVSRKTSLELRPIDFLWIQPSEDLGDLARKYAHRLPLAIKLLLKPLGSLEHSSEIVSYLLFHPDYCKHLLEIGRRDAMKRRLEILHFFSTPPSHPNVRK